MNSLMKITKNIIFSNVISKQILSRNISLSPISRLKEIKVSEEDNTITVEAVRVKSDRMDKLVATHSGNKDCCPLCRLNLRRLEYTVSYRSVLDYSVREAHQDVLILNQFVESNGKVMPQTITGLCHRMHKRVSQLVKRAQRCQLMPRPPEYKSYGPWDQLNTYHEWPTRVRDQPIKLVEPKYWASDYSQNKL